MNLNRFGRRRTRNRGEPGPPTLAREPKGGMAPLACGRCGVRYGRAAVAREPTLMAGAICRRCGGTLQPHDAEARSNGAGTVVVGRAEVGGSDGVSVV